MPARPLHQFINVEAGELGIVWNFVKFNGLSCHIFLKNGERSNNNNWWCRFFCWNVQLHRLMAIEKQVPNSQHLIINLTLKLASATQSHVVRQHFAYTLTLTKWCELLWKLCELLSWDCDHVQYRVDLAVLVVRVVIDNEWYCWPSSKPVKCKL